ncbi:hypothetical protein Acsp04_35360 [Actinomadura sp. NBRC 104425]|nr:hypothetical protein Acsp04_35360 [Actinomadura sp. NBRC 104425]
MNASSAAANTAVFALRPGRERDGERLISPPGWANSSADRAYPSPRQQLKLRQPRRTGPVHYRPPSETHERAPLNGGALV